MEGGWVGVAQAEGLSLVETIDECHANDVVEEGVEERAAGRTGREERDDERTGTRYNVRRPQPDSRSLLTICSMPGSMSSS